MTTSRSTAVVTGGGRGIGLAIARGLAAAGHRVLVTDVDETAARSAAEEIGMGCEWVRQDIREVDSHRLVAMRAAEIGPLRVWVNNAGVLIADDSWTHDHHDIAAAIDINLTGAIDGSHAAVRAMSRNGGGILNIASIAALGPVPGLAVYAATKAALLSFTTSLQGDINHAGLPIRVRALCPDVTDTDMVASRATDPGAATLFSGSQTLSTDAVARAGLKLLGSRQIFRVHPRVRGLVARSSGVCPSIGLKAATGARQLGERTQRSRWPAMGGDAPDPAVGHDERPGHRLTSTGTSRSGALGWQDMQDAIKRAQQRPVAVTQAVATSSSRANAAGALATLLEVDGELADQLLDLRISDLIPRLRNP